MKARLDRGANLLIGWGYVCTLMFFMAHILYAKPPVLETLALSVLAYGLIHLVIKSRVASYILLGITAVGALFVTFVCWVETPLSKPVLFIVEGMMDMWYCLFYNIPRNSPEMLLFAQVFMILAAFVISIGVILLYQKYFSFYLITGFSLALALFSWFMTGKENRLIFCVFCTLTILSYVRHVYKKRKRLGLVSDNLPLGTMLIYTLPLALLPVLLISFVPKKNQPLQFPWLDQKIMQVIDYFEQRYRTVNSDFFSLASTGFSSGSKRLGGPVRPNNVVVMEVKADRRTYLRGAAYSWYENNAWAQTSNKEGYSITNQLGLDKNETYSGWTALPTDELFPSVSEEDRELLTNLSEGNLYDILFPTYSIDIKYRNMTTQTVFMPLKTILPLLKEDNSTMSIIQDLHGIAITHEKIPTNTSYKLEYIQPMYGEPLLKKALTFSHEGLYNEAFQILFKELEEIREKISYSIGWDLISLKSQENEISQKLETLIELNQHTQNIRSEFTQLNPDIPQRVKDMAYDITKDCTSDYEKVVTIEQYLRNNYQYSLNTPYIPEGKDFVEYFLFEDTQGYCTYFATSMTVLLRSLNIPARYIEGYVLPDEANDDKIYTVTNQYAHAWVEVYFEGFGWLTFEPTASYADAMNYRVTTEAMEASSYYYPSLEEMMERYRGDEEIPGYIPMTPLPPETQTTDPSKFMKMLPWLLIGLLLLAILVNIVLLNMGNLRMRWLKGNKKVLKSYEAMLKWLSHLGYEIRAGETLTEFSARMDELFIMPQSNFRDTAPIFIKVRYGGITVSPEDIKKVEQLFADLKKAVVKDLGVKRYHPLRYMFMGI